VKALIASLVEPSFIDIALSGTVHWMLHPMRSTRLALLRWQGFGKKWKESVVPVTLLVTSIKQRQ